MNAYDVAGLVMHGRPDPREKVFTLCELVVAYRTLSREKRELKRLKEWAEGKGSLARDEVKRQQKVVANARQLVEQLEAFLGIGP